MSFMCVLVVLVLESPEWKRSGSHDRDHWSTISEEVWTEVRHRPLIRVAGCLLINLAHWAFKPLSQQLLKVYLTHLGQYVTPALLCSVVVAGSSPPSPKATRSATTWSSPTWTSGCPTSRTSSVPLPKSGRSASSVSLFANLFSQRLPPCV